jgi:hypothetical protein
MKKIRLLFIAILAAALLFFTTACKGPVLDITWNKLEGSGTYHSLDNTSTIKLTGRVELSIPNVATETMWGKITDWEYVISEGDTIVLDINSENSYAVLGDYTLDKSEESITFLWINIETVIPRTGDIYNGATPDMVTLSLWIIDNNGNQYALGAEAPFHLTRD